MIRAMYHKYLRVDLHLLDILRGTVAAFFLKILGAGLTFLFGIFLARKFGPEDYGSYSVALTVATIAGIVSRAGLDQAQLRFVAACAVEGEWGTIKRIQSVTTLIIVVVSIFVTFLIWNYSGWISTNIFYKPWLKDFIRGMSFLIVPLNIALLYAELLRGLKQIPVSIMIQNVLLPAGALVLSFVCAKNIYDAIHMYVIAGIGTAAIGYIVWRRRLPSVTVSDISSFTIGTLMNSGFIFLSVMLMDIATSWGVIIFLGIWVSNREVGLYSAAWRVAMLISFMLTAVNSITAPKLAGLFHQGDRAAFNSVAKNSSTMALLFALPALVIFTIFSRSVMNMYGEQFIEAANLLMVLALGQCINAATGPVAYLLTMSGNERKVRNIYAICAVVSIIANIVLIPRLGSMGAAIATASSISLQNLLLAVTVRRTLGISMFPFSSSSMIKLS